MKKNKLTLFLFILLSAIAAYLYYTNKTSTIKEELKDFAVKDTASITKIFLADKDGNKITLDKISANHWKVNNKYDARNDAVDLLLQTMYQLEVKSPVSKAAFNTVVKTMAVQSKKIEIYQGGDQPSKVYFVGHSTQDNLGTYMLLENSAMPFVMCVPGFMGYLTTRFILQENEWRDTKIFRYEISDIQSVEVNYFEKTENSFLLHKNKDGKFIFKSLHTSKTIENIDKEAALGYFASFKNVNCEFYVLEINPATKDSIIQHCKKFTITITDSFGTKNTAKAFNKPIKKGELDVNGNPILYDIDRMYGLINDDKDFVIIQYYVFDPLTPPISYFHNVQNVK